MYNCSPKYRVEKVNHFKDTKTYIELKILLFAKWVNLDRVS